MTQRFSFIAAAVLFSGMVATGQNPAPPQQSPQAQQSPAAKATIEGTVVRSGSGQPLKGVQISVQRTDTAGSRGGNRGALPNAAAGLGALGDLLNTVVSARGGTLTSVSTDSAGHFAVTGLDAGQYRITADREGLIRQEYGRRTTGGRGTSVAISSGQHFAANFQMDAAGVISGRVRDNAGEPVFRATVQAYAYQYSNGDRSLAQVATVQTDDLGQYRLFPIVPGDYFLSVTALPESNAPSQADASAPPAGGGLRGGQIQLLAGNNQVAGLPQNALIQTLGLPGGAAPFFYPGTIDPDSAAAIHVAASAEVRGIDLNLRPTPTVTISGRVAAPFALGQNNGRGAQTAAPQAGGRGGNANAAGGILNLLGGATGQNAQVTLTRIGGARAGLGALLGGLNQIRVGADGAFQIPNVAPGPYYLNATANDNGQRYTGRIRVDVGTADINNAVVEVHSGVEVHGKITVDNPPSQFKMSQLRINLVEAGNPAGDIASTIGNLLQGAAGGGGAAAAAGRGAAATGGRGAANATPQVADDGTFTLNNVATSVEYRVTISNASGGYLLDGRIGAADALGSTFTVDQGSMLQLRIGFATGRVNGTVTDAGKVFPGAQVVLVPDPPLRGRNDLYFSSTSDANGAFSFSAVPVGGYRMFAWEDVPSGAYQYAEFLRQYEQRGIPIRVDQGGSNDSELKLIPATAG